jgi:dipeptidyl aminopeptidase/acylaminoacyl peptidase
LLGKPSSSFWISKRGEIAGALEFSADGRYLAMSVSGASSPSDVWVLDLAKGAFTRVTRSPHAGVDLAKLPRPELLHFRSHDGLELSGWLYRPRSGKAPFPTVLSFHGGPEGQERPNFSSTYQALLSRGIAVFAPNVRGSSGFGKKFVNLDNGELRFEGVKDIRSCVEAVVRSGAADPKRIGIMGGSYGGYMVMAGLSEFPDLFAAGANLFGVVNFETFFKHTEPWMAAISTIEYGDPATQADLLRRLSPIHKVDRVTAPTIVLHGANDTNVPVVEAEQVVENLKKRSVPVEYVLFPDEGHGAKRRTGSARPSRSSAGSKSTSRERARSSFSTRYSRVHRAAPLFRTTLTSGLPKWDAREGLLWPRRMAPPSRTLSRSSSKRSGFTGTPIRSAARSVATSELVRVFTIYSPR